MTHPTRYIWRMVLFLVLVGGLLSPLAVGLLDAFDFNPGLNGVVVGLFLMGTVINFRQVWRLMPEVRWLDGVQRHTPQTSQDLRLLSPLAHMIGGGLEQGALSTVAMRSVMDSLAARLDEQRELARYFVGLLIFLGLLGTFWGLSHAVGSMGQVIRSLSLGGDDANAAFEHLKAGMQAPLGGMGMAFSTSLFGLAGSLILGFLDLQAGQAQNTFYNELEEWLTAQTVAPPAAPVAPAPSAAVPAYIHALLDRTAERLDQVAQSMQASEHTRQQTLDLMDTIAHRLSTLSELVRADQALVARLGESQVQIQPLLVRLVDETVKGRDHVVGELQAEIRLLAKSLAQPLDSGEE